MHYLDRYLTRRVVNKRVFQLAAMAALLLAVKLNETTKLSMSSMIELSRGYFTVAQLEAMEKSIMRYVVSFIPTEKILKFSMGCLYVEHTC